MCQECNDDDQNDANFLNSLEDYEKEEFITVACGVFNNVIQIADQNDVLHDLIMNWPEHKQAAFTYACVTSLRAQEITQMIVEDDED